MSHLQRKIEYYVFECFVAGNLSSRSKAPSRGAFEAPSDEYTGPKLYVKPSQKQKSNRTIIINAVSHCCLAGVVNTDNKNKVLEVRKLIIFSISGLRDVLI